VKDNFCPICGAKGPSFFVNFISPELSIVNESRKNRGKSPLISLDNSLNVYRCVNCKAGFECPMPDKHSLSDFYKDFYSGSFKGIHTVDFDQSVYSKYDTNQERKRLNYLDKFCSKGRLLDIGCSTGGFIYSASNNGWFPIGLEIAEPAARIAKNNGLLVVIAESDKLPFLDNTFSAVTMNSVLEHCLTPNLVLKEAFRVLTNNGVFMATTSHFYSLECKILRFFGFNAHGLIFEHLYYYSKKSLRALTEMLGFKVISLSSLQFSGWNINSPWKHLTAIFKNYKNKHLSNKDNRFIDSGKPILANHNKKVLSASLNRIIYRLLCYLVLLAKPMLENSLYISKLCLGNVLTIVAKKDTVNKK